MKCALVLACVFAIAVSRTAVAADVPAGHPAFNNDANIETEAQDLAWKKDLDTACAYLKTNRVPSKDQAEACARLADSEPRCMGYRDFAALYLKMKDDGIAATDVADSFAAMEKNTALYPADYFIAIRRLYQVAFFSDRKSLGSAEKFGERAYRACMSGRLL
jgi:hypothetical protein